MVLKFDARTTHLTFLILCVIFVSEYRVNGNVAYRPTTSPSKLPPWTTMDEIDDDPDPDQTPQTMFTLNYPRIQIPFEITLWVLLASFAKIGEQSHILWKAVLIYCFQLGYFFFNSCYSSFTSSL